MNVIRKLLLVILKKGGLKKVVFKRLLFMYVFMGYGVINIFFEFVGKGFDKVFKDWKKLSRRRSIEGVIYFVKIGDCSRGWWSWVWVGLV